MKRPEFSPPLPAEIVKGQKQRAEVELSALKEGAHWEIDYFKEDKRFRNERRLEFSWKPGSPPLDEDETRGLIAEPRLVFTKEQIVRAQKEMERDLSMPEAREAAALLEKDFLPWLLNDGILENLTDENLGALYEALDSLRRNLGLEELIGIAKESAETIRKEWQSLSEFSQEKHGYPSGYNFQPLRNLGPSLMFTFSPEGEIVHHETPRESLSLVANSAVVSQDSDGWTEGLPVLQENFWEAFYLTNMIVDQLKTHPYAPNDFFRAEERAALIFYDLLDADVNRNKIFVTEKSYLVTKRDDTKQGELKQEMEPIAIASLVRAYALNRMAIGIASAFEQASDEEVFINGIDQVEGARGFFLEHWNDTLDQIPADVRERLDEKYKILFAKTQQMLQSDDHVNAYGVARFRQELIQESEEQRAA